MVNVDTLTVHHRIFKITASTVIRQRILILVLGRLPRIFNELPSEEVVGTRQESDLLLDA